MRRLQTRMRLRLQTSSGANDMGTNWFTDGVVAMPGGRIQFDFVFEGKRYRPSIRRPPSPRSILRQAFEYGYRDQPEKFNPARGLRSARQKKRDRPVIDPFSMHDAESLIAAMHRDWGEAQGNKVDHEHVFCDENGEPFRNLQRQGTRWRKSLQSLKLRYRRPYTARHSSVSWNLMIGKNPLWVSRQHGHSISTMLRVYAAWAEGATETDVGAIRRSMNPCATTRQGSIPACRRIFGTRSMLAREGSSPAGEFLSVDLPLERHGEPQVRDNYWKILAEASAKSITC